MVRSFIKLRNKASGEERAPKNSVKDYIPL
jgi:hypothetical protein